jgi:hypothetical protein
VGVLAWQARGRNEQDSRAGGAAPTGERGTRNVVDRETAADDEAQEEDEDDEEQEKEEEEGATPVPPAVAEMRQNISSDDPFWSGRWWIPSSSSSSSPTSSGLGPPLPTPHLPRSPHRPALDTSHELKARDPAPDHSGRAPCCAPNHATASCTPLTCAPVSTTA